MADNLDEVEDTENEQESSVLRAIRRELKNVKKERDELKSFQRSAVFKEAGLDPNKGIGKAIAKLYDGEPDVDAIREFAAAEFDWEPDATQTNGNNELNEAEQERLSAQQRADQLRTNTEPVLPPDLDTQIADAEKAGDVRTSIALKQQKLKSVRA